MPRFSAPLTTVPSPVTRRYVTYGEQEWREATEACLKRMELYDDNSEPPPRLGLACANTALHDCACLAVASGLPIHHVRLRLLALL